MFIRVARIFPVLSFVSVLLLCGNAYADTQTTRSNLMSLLSGYEYTPDESAIKNAGENVEQVLREIAGDKSVLIFRRIRAMHALGYFNSAETSQFLEKTLLNKKEHQAVRASAVYSFAKTAGESAVTSIAPLLTDNNLLTRTAAESTLRRLDTVEAREALSKARVGTELKKEGSIRALDQ